MIQYDAFVSYSRRDEALVKPVVKLLGVGKRRIFWDAQLDPGERWMDSIAGALAGSATVIVIWCCHSAESRYVDAEVHAALTQDKTVVPVLICPYPLREPLDEIQGVDFREVTRHPCLGDHAGGEALEQVAARDFVGEDAATAIEVWRNTLRPSAPKAPVIGVAALLSFSALALFPVGIVVLLLTALAGWTSGYFRGMPIDRASLQLAAVIETAIRRAEARREVAMTVES
jgi:hypothetical protein